MADYELLQMSVATSLEVIDSMVKGRSSYRNPCYKDLIAQLVGVSMIVTPFPKLEQQVEKMLEEVEALQQDTEQQS